MNEISHDLIYARNYARDLGTWVVVVVPDNQLTQSLQMLAAVAEGDHFSGRTALVGNKGGRLSLVDGNTPSFLPEGQEYDVLFLGWGGSTDNKGMETWRKTARREIRRS